MGRYKGFRNCKILVDGPFKKEVKDIKLHWKGSANQRVIDVKKTIDSGKVVVLED